MSVFNVNFDKLSKLMLPIQLRTQLLVEFAKVLVSPIANLHSRFMVQRAANLYVIAHNGQVCRLEAMLNDRFDPTLRRIYIVDGAVVSPKTLYRRLEAKPVYFRRRSEGMPVFLRRRSELTFGGTFVVKVPSVLTFDIVYMKASINEYKMAGKAYTIQLF